MKRREKRKNIDFSTDGMVTKGFVKMYNDTFIKITNEANCQSVCVYISLLSHRNTDTKKCFPRIELISERCNISESTVRRCIKSLVDIGVLTISKNNKYRGNTYEFPLETD